MKPLLFCCLLLLLHISAQAQRLDTTRSQNMTDRELGRTYLKKSKNQKITGWVMLGGGLSLYILGLANMDLFSNQASGADLAITIGGFSTIGSIPLFISSARNKGRAEILLRSQNVPLGIKQSKQVPGFTLRVPVGR